MIAPASGSREGRLADPVGERGAFELHAGPAVDHAPPVQEQVIGLLCRQDMGEQARPWPAALERPQHDGAGADLVGERRQTELDPLQGIALALPVERLMLTVLLEQDHGSSSLSGGSPT